MADPIVTEPYDPVLHGDIQRYRCPGTNTRNSMWNYTAATRCRVRKVTDPVLKPYRKNGPKFRLTYPPRTPITATKRKCAHIISTPNFALGLEHKHRFCLHYTQVRVQTFGGKRAKCSFRGYSPLAPIGKWEGSCRWDKTAVTLYGAKRACRVIFSTNHLEAVTPNNRFCLKFFPHSANGRSLCRRVDVNVRVYVMRTNIERCRVTPVVDFSTYTFKKVCKKLYFTSNNPIRDGVVGGSYIKCKVTQVKVQILLGNRICNLLKGFNKNTLQYKTFTGFYCKRTLVEFRPAQRWKCERTLFGYANNLIFGRVYGGRIFNPFLPRTSGRMMGRIR